MSEYFGTLWQGIVGLQREIYLAFGGHIRTFAEDGNWQTLAVFLPLGIALGAVHALTPGHSKAVLATYLAGTATRVHRGLVVSLVLSFTHVAMAVVIALLSLPLVSRAFGADVGRAPLLEDISRGVIGLIGLWMIWQALRRPSGDHGPGTGATVGFVAGLVPCPLTLFVMIAAISRGVPEAGLAFAVVMMVGVAITLSTVAVFTILFRQQLGRFLAARPNLLDRVSRALGIGAGTILVIIALATILGR
jgi:nickel/cobalt transporter (NicO) family protein